MCSWYYPWPLHGEQGVGGGLRVKEEPQRFFFLVPWDLVALLLCLSLAVCAVDRGQIICLWFVSSGGNPPLAPKPMGGVAAQRWRGVG